MKNDHSKTMFSFGALALALLALTAAAAEVPAQLPDPDGKPDTFEYVIDVPKAGKYALSARVVTVNMNPHLLLTLNDVKSAIDIALPYTVGMWKASKPVEISLVKGKNTLRFTREAPNHGLTIKDFTLKPLK